jgi:hypothetical protein
MGRYGHGGDDEGRTYGYDTLKVLISVWRLAGMPSGKYLAATMDLWLPKLEAFGALDAQRLSPAVKAQLLKISGATIDRLHQPTRDVGKPKGLSVTKAGPLLLRNSITVRKAGDEHEQARQRPRRAEERRRSTPARLPLPLRHGPELKLLNALYALVRVRLNLFTATTKASGWRSNKHGKKTRIYDKPRTPYQRVTDFSGILTGAGTDGDNQAGRPHPRHHRRHPDPADRPPCGKNTGSGSIIHASTNS